MIIHDDKVLATEHDYGEWKDTGNSRAAGRKKGRSERREIREALGADISIDSRLCTITYQYSHGIAIFLMWKDPKEYGYQMT